MTRRPTAVVDAYGNRTATAYSIFGGPSFSSDANQNPTSYDYYSGVSVATNDVNVARPIQTAPCES